MLSFFKSPSFRDPHLGEFVRARGQWRGTLELGGRTAEAEAAGEAAERSTPRPRIEAASDVWSHAALVFVSVAPIGRALAVEFGFTTAWDEEHTLGARFQGGKLLELNGSVLAP